MNIDPERLAWHLPDPEAAREQALADLAAARAEQDTEAVAYNERLLSRIGTIRRGRQVHLTLEDALHRALASSYALKVQRYNPAVETTRLVEAEAVFDATFFTNITYNKIDRPTGSQLIAADTTLFDSTYGLRKLLPTGGLVTGSYGLRRTKTALSFQTINPEYFSNLALEIRQPLLRGFGLDVNRAAIMVANNSRSMSHMAFRREVRDTLRSVEEAYWRLAEARRNVVITARVLAEFEAIYEYLWARRNFDVLPVQLAATKSRLERSRADFVVVRAAVRDAEDRLIALLNDPALNLADHTELIVDDFPSRAPIQVDRLGEVQAALENRPEIKEQELVVANAKIGVGSAKNAELPRLDVVFRYTVDGLAGNADGSFDELSRNRFIEYFVGVEIELPVGNRAARAASRRADLEYSQARAQLESLFETIILEVTLATRALTTAYDQLPPLFASVESSEQEVRSTVARAERKDLNTLNSELSARESLAANRRAVMKALIDYNIAIIDLERAKGTLLRYNNVVIPDGEG